MGLRSYKLKSFLLGCFCGALITAFIIFGFAAFYVIKGGPELMSGYIDNVYVDVNWNPNKNYDWSLDVSQKQQLLLSLGKRKEAKTADRCKLLGPKGNLLVYMVWDDPDVGPGLNVYNELGIIADLAMADSVSNSFFANGSQAQLCYGPYNLPPEAINDSDRGFKDFDFNGQFDWMDVFNSDGTINKSFLLLEGEWKEVIAFDQSSFTAKIKDNNGAVTSCLFRIEEGWHLATKKK